jgi:hypothetical protein
MKCCNIFIILWMALGLAGCSGGDPEMDMGGGEGGTGEIKPAEVKYDSTTAVGEITAFGSIFVNGVEFETDKAEIWMDGVRQSDQASLRLGMVVEVEGSVNKDGKTGEAKKVFFNQFVVGPISGIETLSQSHKRLTVLGQKILVDSNTSFDGVAFASLSVGQVLKVSGFDDGLGGWTATWLQKLSDAVTNDTEIRITGAITAVDANERVVRVNDDVKIDITEADVRGLDPSGPRVGDRVEVRGRIRSGHDKMAASHVQARYPTQTTASAAVIRLEGVVTDFEDESRFVVAGRRIDASLPAMITGNVSELGEGSRVRVSGSLRHDGVLTADELFILPGIARVRLLAPLTSIEKRPEGTQLNVMGNVVTINANTKLGYGLSAPGQAGLITDALRVGDWVEINGSFGGNGITAYFLERKPGGEKAMLQGAVQQVMGDEITVLGVAIDTTNASLQTGPEPYGDRDSRRDGRRDGGDGGHMPPPGARPPNTLQDGIQAGDFVRVLGVTTGLRSLRASEIYAGD